MSILSPAQPTFTFTRYRVNEEVTTPSCFEIKWFNYSVSGRPVCLAFQKKFQSPFPPPQTTLVLGMKAEWFKKRFFRVNHREQ